MSWSAGFGRGVLTPPVPVRLAGFGDRTEPAHSVHDDLEARALWLGDGARAVCLLSLDLLGLSPEFADPVRDAVAQDLGLDRAAVLTSCVHTHSGPNAMADGERLGWTTPDGYLDILIAGCRAAAAGARAAAAPARLRYARGPLTPGISINRRGLPYEPWLSALDVLGPDDRRLGVLANVAIHPVALGSPWLAVSSDWVGPFRDALEADAGGTAVLLSGPLGDVNPHERHTDIETHLAEAHDEASEIGARAAAAVAQALAGAGPVEGGIGVWSRRLRVPAEGDLATLVERTEDEVELVEWAIGDVALVGVPGEPFHALGRAIDAARGGRCLIAALAPSWHGYLPSPFTAGYEESVSLGARAVSMMSEALIAGVGR